MNIGPFTITVHHRMRYVRDLGHVVQCLVKHGVREDVACAIASLAFYFMTETPDGQKVDLERPFALHYSTVEGKEQKLYL